jgi:hypothetical protein
MDHDNKSLCSYLIIDAWRPLIVLIGAYLVANCFVLFGPKTMVLHLLCVYKSLDLYPFNSRVHPQFRSCTFRGQVPRSSSF